MPHINIKYFPPLTQEQQLELTTSIAQSIMNIIKCDEGAISIALEPIEREFWNERVYIPEIVNRKELLSKTPSY